MEDYIFQKKKTKTILVLVHGGASYSYVWDFSEDYSIANSFADAGYAVLTYDRPGYGKSPYLGDPTQLPLSKQQSALYDIVQQTNKGTYTYVNEKTTDKKETFDAFVLIGWSQGGRLTGTYKGRYNDPLVKAAATQGTPILVAPSTQFLAYNAVVVTPQVNAGLDWIALFQTPDQAKEVFDYLPNIDPLIAQQVSTQIYLAPQAEIVAINTEQPLFAQWITQTPAGFPVFIGGADNDFIAPAVPVIANEVAEWEQVSAITPTTHTQISSGHQFQLHYSWPAYVQAILDWLQANKINP